MESVPLLIGLAAGVLLIGLAVGFFWLRLRSTKHARLTVDVHEPPSGFPRLIIHNDGPAAASRVVAQVDGRWIEVTGGFPSMRPTGFSLGADSVVEIPLYDLDRPRDEPLVVEVSWRDQTRKTKTVVRTIGI